MILADRQRLPTQLARPARARRAYQELVLGPGRLSPRSSSVRSMRRWRSWKWRLAGVGDEKGRSGPVTRICKRERCAVESATEVETDQQQLPWSKCRIVERTFAWLGRYRRLAKDWENLNRKALAFLRLASIRLMLRKLCNPSTASGHSRRGLSRAAVDRLPLRPTSGRKVTTWESVAKGHHRHFA